MWIGISALLSRALQMDARQLRTHLFRLAFVGFIYLSLLAAQAQAISFGAPGLRFLTTIVFLNAIFITLAGVSFFSSAITEEKEENTLGLLQMAGIGPMSVLLGKSTSRLVQALMLLLVQFPFTLLSITLGGVTIQQVLAAYASLLAYLFGLANVSLFWSVVCRRTGNAAGATCLCLVLYFIGPELARSTQAWLTSVGWSSARWYQAAILWELGVIQEWEVFRRLSDVMVTGFSGSSLNPAEIDSWGEFFGYYFDLLISTQVVTNVLFGAVCFGLARLLFEPFTADAGQLTDTRGLVARSGSRLRLFSAGRCWENPFVWKDFHFLAGGIPGMMVKSLLYAGVLGTIAAVNYYSFYPYSSHIEWPTVIGVFAACVTGFLVLEASLAAARIFHDEIRLQTMSALLMLPRSIPYIAYSKAAGCLLGLLPGVFWLAFCGIVAAANGWLSPPYVVWRNGFVLDVVFHPGLWFGLLVVSLFVHLTALLSLFVKWGALPLAFLIMILMTWCCPIFSVMTMFIMVAMENEVGHIAASGVLMLINVVGSFVLQMMIGARLQEIGST
jgi:hypothetical protein